MPIEVLMPALSPTMENGKLAKWLVGEGDTITAGMVIAEIETDKATMEVEAVDEGAVGRILVAAGTEGVKVNQPIMLLLEDGEEAAILDLAGPQTHDVDTANAPQPVSDDQARAGSDEKRQPRANPAKQALDDMLDRAQTTGPSAADRPAGPRSDNAMIPSFSPLKVPPPRSIEEPKSQAPGEAQSGQLPSPTPSPSTSTSALAEASDPADATPRRQAAVLTQTDSAHQPSSRKRVSPLARRLAHASGLNLEHVTGTGPAGRIVKRDIETALANGTNATEMPTVTPVGDASGDIANAGLAAAASVATAASAGVAMTASKPKADALVPTATETQAPAAMPDTQILALYEAESYDVVPHDGMRRTIAARLTQSKQTIPHFYQSVDCHLDSLLSARKRMNDSAPKEGPRAYKLSVNDFVIKALALGLQTAPDANVSWTEGGLLRHHHADVGVAVAVEGGLFTPIVRHAELKTLSEISNEMKELADRARERRLKPHEYQGGTTSISNLGMYGIKQFDAVINPPHATILAVGAGLQQPVVRDGQLAVATVMTVTLSCDHRAVDGATGARLLAAFKDYIEDPIRMLV